MEHQHPGHGLYTLHTELPRAAQCDSVTQFKIVFLVDVKEKKPKTPETRQTIFLFSFSFSGLYFVLCMALDELSEHRGRLGVSGCVLFYVDGKGI